MINSNFFFVFDILFLAYSFRQDALTPKQYQLQIGSEIQKSHPDIQTLCYKLVPNKKSSTSFIPVIFLKNTHCTDDHVIIYSHGNASDVSDVYQYIEKLALLYNVNFLAYDYRGYGLSRCFKPNEASTYEDLETVLSFSFNYLKFELEKTFLWGYSLGSGPTIDISSRFQSLGGVILQSPLASVMCWIDSSKNWDFEYKQEDIFCNLNKIENVKAKIFLIHGRDDVTINVKHSLMLYDKYVKSKNDNNQIWLIIADGFGHNDLHEMLDEDKSVFAKKLKKFIRIVKFGNRLGSSYDSTHQETVDHETELKNFYKEKEEKSLILSWDRIQMM